MKVERFELSTQSTVQLIRIDDRIEQVVAGSGVKSGLAVIFVPHTTAALMINENADPDVVRDILMKLNKVIPAVDQYAHREGNSAAHIKSSLFGCSLTILIENGRPLLGTWQSIFLCEFDGPRWRTVYVKILAE